MVRPRDHRHRTSVAARQRHAGDAAHLRVGDDPPQRPVRPQVPDIAPECPVHFLGSRAAGIGVGIVPDHVVRGVDRRVLEASEVRGELGHGRVDRQRGGRVPPQPLLDRVHPAVGTYRHHLIQACERQAEVLALLHGLDRDLDLVAEGIPPHRHGELVGLHVERVIGGVERERHRVLAAVGLALLEFGRRGAEVVARIARVLQIAHAAGRKRAVRRTHQAGQPLLREPVAVEGMRQRLAAAQVDERIAGVHAVRVHRDRLGDAAHGGERRVRACRHVDDRVVGLAEVVGLQGDEAGVAFVLGDLVGIRRVDDVELAASQAVGAAHDVAGHHELDLVEIGQALAGDAIGAAPVVGIPLGDEAVAVARRVAHEAEGAQPDGGGGVAGGRVGALGPLR